MPDLCHRTGSQMKIILAVSLLSFVHCVVLDLFIVVTVVLAVLVQHAGCGTIFVAVDRVDFSSLLVVALTVQVPPASLLLCAISCVKLLKTEVSWLCCC